MWKPTSEALPSSWPCYLDASGQHDPERLICREIGNGLPEYLERFVEPRFWQPG